MSTTDIHLSANPVELDHVKVDSQLPLVQERVESSSQTLNSTIKDQNCLHVDEPVRVLGAKVKENVRIPSYSEIEIEVNVNWCIQSRSDYYVLESSLKSSGLLVARALVRNGNSVPIRLLNPTGKAITLYSGVNVATLSQAVDKSEN